MTPKEIAVMAAKTLDSKKAVDIKVLEITDLTILADYFVICTGSSTTHIKTLTGEVEKILKENGETPHHIEGYMSGSWVLLDFGCVIIHIFLDEAREFYSIERLWADAKPLLITD